MVDDLSGIEISQVDALAAIRVEQQRIQQLIDKATELQQGVEPQVFARVLQDYQQRIEALETQARPLRQQARAELAKLRTLHERLSAELQTARLALQEVEFRHQVGELPHEEFTQLQQTCQQNVAERSKAFDEAERVLQRFVDILPSVPEPPTLLPPVAEPEPAAEPESVTLAAPAALADAPPTTATPAPRTDPFGTIVVVGARLVEQKDGGENRSFPLGTVTSIGRTPDNDIAIKERAVSRHHASIALTDGGFVITDLNSGNGTHVNGRRTNECRLSDGDRIELGDLCFIFKTG